MRQLINITQNQKHQHIVNILHIIILILCIVLIILFSLLIFRNIPNLNDKTYMEVEFWICCFFILDFIIEFLLSDNKWSYFKTHLLFLIISIPYIKITEYMGITFPEHIENFLKFIPLARGAYALAIIVSWLSYSTISTLFTTYLTILLSTVYFASLLFFKTENPVNNLVYNYWQSLWWAFMDVTTVGSNIVAVTATGKILSVLLAGMGMMMFPIFTVYITEKIQKRKKEFEPIISDNKTEKKDTDNKVNS